MYSPTPSDETGVRERAIAGLSPCFYTLHALPLAEAVTIQYTNPLFTALFAPWLLGVPFAAASWQTPDLLSITLGEFPTMLSMAGMGLIVTSIVIITLPSGARHALVR